MKKSPERPADLPIRGFARQEDWAAWLEEHHGASPGLWLKLGKKASRAPSISYPEALETALCYGWIDGQTKKYDEEAFLQRFTPRSKRSIWSKINRAKALALIEGGRMKPAGLQEVERAQADGRWDAAYDSPRNATVPDDLQAALDANQKAKAFFASLNAQNRFAILFRLQTAKKAETRARRIQQFVEMLERHEKLH